MIFRLIIYFMCMLLPYQVFAQAYECDGFEPTFHMTLSKKEIVLKIYGYEPETRHFSPVEWKDANRTGLSAYRVARKNQSDFIAILNEEECEVEGVEGYTHHVYYSDQGITDGCCKLKAK